VTAIDVTARFLQAFEVLGDVEQAGALGVSQDANSGGKKEKQANQKYSKAIALAQVCLFFQVYPECALALAGPYWATLAIDAEGNEVLVTGRFRLHEYQSGPLLIVKMFIFEYEAFLPPNASDEF
jgi:hypothetical protein